MKDILDDLGVSFISHGEHHHTTEGFLQVDCPFCSPGSGKMRMGLARNGKAAHCWTCGTHKIGDALCEITGLGWQRIKEVLAHLYNGIAYAPTTVDPPGRLVEPTGVGRLLPAHRNYLEGRGYDPDVLESMWQVGGIGLQAKLAWRLYIPITEKKKRVSWTTRSLCAEGRRYISASKQEESISHKHLLYGEEYCTHAVVVCEGPLDVWRIGPGSVATMGTSCTNAQVMRIAKYPTRIICFDNDAQGAARDLCRKLVYAPGQTTNVCLDAQDPGEAQREELEWLRNLAGI